MCCRATPGGPISGGCWAAILETVSDGLAAAAARRPLDGAGHWTASHCCLSAKPSYALPPPSPTSGCCVSAARGLDGPARRALRGRAARRRGRAARAGPATRWPGRTDLGILRPARCVCHHVCQSIKQSWSATEPSELLDPHCVPVLQVTSPPRPVRCWTWRRPSGLPRTSTSSRPSSRPWPCSQPACAPAAARPLSTCPCQSRCATPPRPADQPLLGGRFMAETAGVCCRSQGR